MFYLSSAVVQLQLALRLFLSKGRKRAGWYPRSCLLFTLLLRHPVAYQSHLRILDRFFFILSQGYTGLHLSKAHSTEKTKKYILSLWGIHPIPSHDLTPYPPLHDTGTHTGAGGHRIYRVTHIRAIYRLRHVLFVSVGRCLCIHLTTP